ncbi:HK97-gp10 family putative phage morphogenesis protein [Macrococcoides bohemicum]|uniref:HK97-gp10 family putative phage morphogenesis protein n=1 Tax=Macrococcoides bohemicum TaxID=1903056 RepID=UPI00165E392C|nr:HK97-gp10 family putative phage morphogenesis protein [Macrococcus bohemicus]MBC9873331.1 hypothetical protein [Macrococcus bohemicus]
MSIDIEGFGSIEKNIKKLLKNIENGEERIVKAGAEVECQGIKDNLAVQSGRSKEELTISDYKYDETGCYVEIGWTDKGNAGHRIHIVEWGSVHQLPQLRISKALNSNKDKKLNAMKQELKKIL